MNRRREFFVALVIWVFIAMGAGTYFGLTFFLKRESDTIGQTTETVEESEETETPDAAEAGESGANVETTEAQPIAELSSKISASPFAGAAQNANGTNSATTYDAVGHVMEDGMKYVYYKTMVWGTVAADFEDFRAKVAETLNDGRGWVRAGLRFVEVTDGQDLNIILSDAVSLEGYNGYCSGELSCTSGYNEVIINDIRWREGTAETAAGGMSIRDYQNMVVNHEVGHWLGHYSHIEACDVDGGAAPIMLQQSTGLRNCGTFNPWPLDSELWTLR